MTALVTSSSIRTYNGFSDHLTDVSVVSSCFSDSESLHEFLYQQSEDSFQDEKSLKYITDEKAKETISHFLSLK